jgi:hypothetical protein
LCDEIATNFVIENNCIEWGWSLWDEVEGDDMHEMSDEKIE